MDGHFTESPDPKPFPRPEPAFSELTRMPSRCPYCQESVQPFAKMCPHCRKWLQGPWRWLGKLGAVAGALAFLFPLYFILRMPTRWQAEEFTKHQAQLEIFDTKMDPPGEEAGSTVNILGRIKNGSDVTWDNPYFEVHCFNRKGELIDTHSTYDSGLILVPNTVHAFRVSFTSRRPASEIASFRVFLRHARDAKRWG